MTVYDNPVLPGDRFPPLSETSFTKVAPAYVTQLRLSLLPLLLFAAPVWWILFQIPWSLTVPAITALALLPPVLLVALLALIWAPRRYRLTGYCLRQHDLHLRTGALWQSTTSVTFSRIQHLEVTQGPVERLLGLARLLVYTAGGSGQDLAIPGLQRAQADQLRLYVLEHVDQTQTMSSIEEDTP